jgi:succinoglycan biosynthesis transport protein ExoP
LPSFDGEGDHPVTLPSRRELPVVNLDVPRGELGEDERVRRDEVWRVFVRNRWLIAVCILVAVIVAAVFAWRATPIYEASASLRIEDKAPDLPGVFQALSKGSDVITEIQVLQSRTLAEDATSLLGLQVRLVEPLRVSRDSLLTRLHVEREAKVAEYGLVRRPDGRFVVFDRSTEARMAVVGPGDSVEIGGVRFVLTPAAAGFEELALVVSPFDQAVARLTGSLDVTQAAREAGIVKIGYRDTDPQLAQQVPNVIVARFLARRQDAQKAEARSTVRFLRGQLDTLAGQLRASEDELRRFREREGVVNPEIEGSGQVQRMISLQSERTTLEAERVALAQILDELRTSALHDQAQASSSYRRLMAFPTLLRDRAASELLSSLTSVQDQRAALLTRRTEKDPDVQALTTRVADIENQLHQFASTYLEGLTNQIASLDTGLKQFGQQLRGVPRRELDFARLERKPKLLEEIYTLLQSRMQEAEIAEAVEDPSVRIVDVALTPAAPAGPRRMLYLFGGTIAGLLLGISAAFTREYLDSKIRTRRDVRVITGLPVMGLIPRLKARRRRLAIIAERQKTPVRGPARALRPPGQPPRTAPAGTGYSFLAGSDGVATLTGVDEGSAERQAPKPNASPVSPPGSEIRVTLPPPGTATSEAYGSLQTNVAFSRRDTQVKTLVFTSPLPGEGKTTTAVNFALAGTQRGLKVLLVDADVRRGIVHTVLEAPQTPGLSEVLAGTAPLEQACRHVVVGDRFTLHVLPTGRLPASPSGMLESPQMRDFLARVREDYDLVVLDTPPVNILTDAALLGAQADGVLIVVRAGVTDAAALAYAAEQLGHVGAPVVGVVLNDIDFRRDVGYDSAYRYYNYDAYRSASTS